MTFDVIFEKRAGDAWVPTSSRELKPGEVTRLKKLDGSILGEARVAAKQSTDPDSHVNFDLALDWVEK